MENFVVSARKYRPSTFDSVIGQEHITVTLKNAIRNKQLAHAFLFCGPRGVGKTTCARILAKTINCENITAECEACNTCDSCKSFNANASFNIYELDAASNNSVEDIRGLVEQVRYPPQGAKYKIYIIDEVHMLSSQAFNAFLKTLEEPPPYAKFILATTEKHKILPTILSRCQVFDFHRITIEHAVSQLKKITASEGIEAEEEALHVIAQKADGAMRDALSIFDRIVSFTGKKITYQDVIVNLNILDFDYYFKAVDLMYAADVAGLFLLFDKVLANGFDAQHFLIGLNDHIRNLLVCKYPDTLKLLEVAPSVAQRFKQQASSIPATVLMNAMNLINRCELDYRLSKNQRLHVELTLLKCCHIQSVIQLKAESQVDKKKTPELTVVQPVSEPVKETVTPALPNSIQPARQTNTATYKAAGNGNLQSKLEKLRQKPVETVQENISSEVREELVQPMAITVIQADAFNEVWKQYILQLESQRKMSLTVPLKSAVWNIRDSNTIELTLSSQLEKEMFEEERINLMPFLRGRLNHPSLEIEIKVIQQTGTKTAFTAEDKFKAMAENNPVLNDLRNALGLELEY
jgi:DNA polymerase-3 subunit gamma/tau